MTIMTQTQPGVSTETEGAAVHTALLAEARVLLTTPISTPEEAAALIDAATARELDEVTLSMLADAVVG